MHMRMLQVTVNPGRVAELQEMYEREVMPRLQQTPGCLYVGLTKSVRDNDEYISLTLWESQQHAEAYEKSGVFAELLKGAEPYLAGTSEWRLHLSKDNVLEYEPVPVEPVVQAYSIAEKRVSAIMPRRRVGPLFVRIVSPHIRPGKVDEFKSIYRENVIPVLQKAEGCLYAALTENANDPDHPISLTIWNSLPCCPSNQTGSTGQGARVNTCAANGCQQTSMAGVRPQRSREVEIPPAGKMISTASCSSVRRASARAATLLRCAWRVPDRSMEIACPPISGT